MFTLIKTYTLCFNTWLTHLLRWIKSPISMERPVIREIICFQPAQRCKTRNGPCAVDQSITWFIKCCGRTEQCHPSGSNQRWSWQRKLGCTRMHWHRPFKLADSEAWTWQWFLKLIYLLFAGKGYHFETHSKSFQFQDTEESNNATRILVWFLCQDPLRPVHKPYKMSFCSLPWWYFFAHFLFLFLKLNPTQILFHFKHHLHFFLKYL